MAGNQIDINLSVRDQGNTMRQRRKDAEGLNSELERSKVLNKEYGVARSAVGTGAAGRDFAKQSQGLGGLVRLYATFAANLFAAQAAFSALSNAMDTTNMIRGMDQLGAVSGVALGGLSKRFAEITQGAISFREAAQAVTKATSAGLGVDQTLKIASVATKASQALGVDLSDAVSRLSRGITKLEPELLDELGIFTKIEPAVDAYALKIGKASSQLTDFERRQAFAVAVLEEGNKKFSEINIETNPYQKLLASFKDIAQVGLSAINTVIAPIARLLSESPIGLTTVIAGIAGLLLKQAIPAVTSWRQNLQETAKDSAQAARDLATKFGESFVARHEKLFDIPALRKQGEEYTNELAGIDRKIASTRKDLGRSFTGTGKNIKEVISSTEPLDPKQTAAIDSRIKTIQKQIDSGKAKNLARLEDEKRALTEILALEKQRADLVYKQGKLKADLAIREEKVQTVSDKPVKRFSEEWQRIQIAKRAEERALRAQSLSDISKAAEEGGLMAGFSKTKEETSKTSGLFNKLRIVGAGAFVTIGNAIGTALSALGPYIAVFSLVAPILATVYEKIRGNSEAIEATKKAFEQQTEAVRAANLTLEYYGSRGTQRTVEGAYAASNALFTLSESFDEVTKKATAELSSGNWLYKAAEAVQNFFGFGTQAELAVKSIESVGVAFKLLESNTKFLYKFKEEASEALNISATSSIEEFNQAIKGASPETLVKLSDIQKSIATQFKGATEETKAFNDQLTETAKIASGIVTSLLPSTGIAKWAMQGFKNVNDLNKELAKGADNLDEFRKLVNSTDLAKKFGPDTVNALLDVQKEINELYDQRNSSLTTASKLREVILKNEEEYNKRIRQAEEEAQQTTLTSGISTAADLSAWKDLKETIEKDKTQLASIELFNTKTIDDKVREVYKKIGAQQASSAQQFAKTIEIALSASYEKANLVLKKGLVGLVQEELPKAFLEYDIAIKENQLQKQQLDQTINLIKSIEQNSLVLEQNSIVQKEQLLESLKSRPADRQAEVADRIRTLEQDINFSQQVLDARVALLQQGLKIVSTGNVAQAPAGIDFVGGNNAFSGAPDLVKQAALASSTFQSVVATAAARAQRQEFENSDKVAKVRLANQELLAKANIEIRKTEEEIFRLNQDKQKLDIISINNYTSELEKLQAINKVEAEIFDKTTEKDRRKLAAQSVNSAALEAAAKEFGISGQLLESYKQNNTLQQEILVRYDARRKSEKELLELKQKEAERLKEIDQRYAEINRKEETRLALLQSQRSLEDARLTADKSRFDTLAGLSRYSEQEIQDKTMLYTIEQARLEQSRAQEDLQNKINTAQRKYQEALEKDPNMSLDSTKAAEEAWLRESVAAENATKAIKESTAAKIENARLTGSVSDQQKKYADLASQSFEKLGDAIADFAKTGKFNFKDLVDSMISDFIRLTIRLQMQKLVGGSGGKEGGASMFGNFLATALGITPYGFDGMAQGANLANLTNQANTNISLGAITAKGAAYDAGVKKFGMGGLFTNSVVSQPTLFKFANGTGLMGEAGPEAIMPLTRDNSGRLGVTAQNTQSQNVEVVVNNFSGAKTETKETTDSSGNRKIEVIVGEMVASEVARTNSPMQRAMGSSYGTKPSTIRR